MLTDWFFHIIAKQDFSGLPALAFENQIFIFFSLIPLRNNILLNLKLKYTVKYNHFRVRQSILYTAVCVCVCVKDKGPMCHRQNIGTPNNCLETMIM